MARGMTGKTATASRAASGKTGNSKTSGNYTTRDQAAGLRRLLGNIGPRVLPVAGGAHGEERAGVVVELATAATAQGYSVVVLDQTPF